MPTLLILGATSDMAIAIAHRFASAGYDLQLAARRPESIASVVSDVQIRYGVKAVAMPFEATDTESHAAFCAALDPLPDVAICVFGLLGEQATAQADWAQALPILQTNYTGAVSVMERLAGRFGQRGSGTLVGISSVAGERGRMSNYLYGSAKAGFTAYLSGLRNRMAHAGVHVLTVKPGFVYTRMTANLTLPPLLTAKPEEVANAVFNGCRKRTNTLYVRWFWRWIMLIIRLIPEPVFKKLKL